MFQVGYEKEVFNVVYTIVEIIGFDEETFIPVVKVDVYKEDSGISYEEEMTLKEFKDL